MMKLHVVTKGKDDTDLSLSVKVSKRLCELEKIRNRTKKIKKIIFKKLERQPGIPSGR